MRDQQSARRRAEWLWSTISVVVLLLGAVALCTVALLAVTENYDGVPSMLNPIAVLSCCLAVVLVITALAWWLVYKADRDR